MKKKKLLIVAHHLTIGGVQKSLISALKVIDYEKFDVTLYIRKSRTDLLSFVDERVNVIINDDKTHYYRKPRAVVLQILIAFFRLIKNEKRAESYKEKLSSFLVKSQMQYEKTKYFINNPFDVAIAYSEGYNTLFVQKYIEATKKYAFFRSSTDDHHKTILPIINDFDNILVLHDEHRKLVGTWYPDIKNKLRIIENYTDKDFIAKQSKEIVINKTDVEIVLCSCGRFTREKGFDLAVEAAKILKEQNNSFSWYFVGDGPERSNIEKLINQYGLNENIIITGMQKNPYPYMVACDVYVQPSYEESYGNTMVEAHKLLKPVVTTATLGGQKLVRTGENGIVCEITADGLANGIEKLLTNKVILENIKSNLENRDYFNEMCKYKTQWKNLLEG